jgi:hypothetical protein
VDVKGWVGGVKRLAVDAMTGERWLTWTTMGAG